jgi:hypothetical protein
VISVIDNKSSIQNSIILDDSDDESIRIPNIGNSVSEAFRNVENESSLITGCNVDMATLRLFEPHPFNRDSKDRIECERVFKALIIGYFQAASRK